MAAFEVEVDAGRLRQPDCHDRPGRPAVDRSAQVVNPDLRPLDRCRGHHAALVRRASGDDHPDEYDG